MKNILYAVTTISVIFCFNLAAFAWAIGLDGFSQLI